MLFTALHQALGAQPGPLTSEMLDEAVAAGVEESDRLDWKERRPDEGSLAQSDIVKNIAAMANSGGGLLVFGVAETQRRATGRLDVGELTESYERTLRKVAVSGINPPVFGLDVISLGEAGARALAVVVPPSVDAPHLLYRNDYFGAPTRNHADTEWMRERQLEALYRARLDERRSLDQALLDLYDELAAGRDSDARAWLIVVAQPRIPTIGHQLDAGRVRVIVQYTASRTLRWVDRNAGIHPLESVDTLNPQYGLRRWVLVNAAEGGGSWRESWMAIHDSGAVTLAHAIGGHRISATDTLPGYVLRSRTIECAVSDFMALLNETTNTLGVLSEYDVMLGIDWEGGEPLVIESMDDFGTRHDGTSIPLARYTKARSSVALDVDDAGFLDQTARLALDAVNQGGVQNLRGLPMPNS